MNWRVPAAMLALLAVSGNTAPPAEIPPIATPAIDIEPVSLIHLQNERHRRLTVAVQIKGQGPFDFLIDTGAQATVLSRSLAERLELTDREPAILIGMASARPVETTIVPEFAVGGREFYIRTAPILEGAYIGGADGILGLDSLQGQRVLFDFDERTLSVADAKEQGGNRGFEIIVRARAKLGQLIITRARVNGVTTSVVVDTGAQASIGNMALLGKLRRARSLGETSLTDVNGVELAGNMHMIDELRLDRAQINKFPIMFADAPLFERLDLHDKPALMLGMHELKMFRRVAIDFESRRVLFDLPRRAVWQSRLASGGIGL